MNFRLMHATRTALDSIFTRHLRSRWPLLENMNCHLFRKERQRGGIKKGGFTQKKTVNVC